MKHEGKWHVVLMLLVDGKVTDSCVVERTAHRDLAEDALRRVSRSLGL